MPSLGGPFAVAVSVAIASMFASCTSGTPQARPSTGATCPSPNGLLGVGERIPASCSLERLDGGVLRLSALAGKPAVINFWASWCTFCIAEMPDIQKVYASMGGRVSFVGVNLLGVEGETRTAAMTFARRTKVRYPLVYDPGAVLFGYFGGAGHILPVTIIVRANGVIADRRFGPLTEAQLRDLLREKLGVS